MAEPFKLGDEVESYCTKCREMANHNVAVLAVNGKPPRVVCKVCNGEHNYRPSPPQTRRSSSGRTTTRRKLGLSLTDEQKTSATHYKIGGLFQQGEVISHPTFGFGEITEIRSPQRMLVLFDGSQKLLIYNTQLH